MKRLTMHTGCYEQDLIDFVQGVGFVDIKWQRKKETFSICLIWENENNNLFISMLAQFLQELIVKESPVYKHSPKLSSVALKTTYEEEKKRIKQFLKNSQTLNIEGYITFRMSEFRHKLDIISYKLIKKLDLTIKE